VFADIRPVIDVIHNHEAGIIVANSLRSRVPPSRTDGQNELSGGVIVGEHLFLETYDTIRRFRETFTSLPPTIASGGLVDIGGVVDCLTAGADAVQICSILDVHRGVHALTMIRRQLEEIAGPLQSLVDLKGSLRGSAVEWKAAAVHSRKLVASPVSDLRALLDDSDKLDDILAETIALARLSRTYTNPNAFTIFIDIYR
jgi:hypothetical protein